MDFTDETIPMPRIGDQAPVFDAVTTQGKIHFPLDFNGKWIILFSHPSDFTPVCTSEFVTFGAMTEEFKALNCQLIGLSVDGLYSHIAWLRTIREKIEYKGKKNVEVQFPLIADVTMEVAHLYGMIQPRESSTNAVRAVFYIDPQGIIRAIIYYPLALGRNFDELKRVLIGLQIWSSPTGRLVSWRRSDRSYPGLVQCGKRTNGQTCQWYPMLRLVFLSEKTPRKIRER